MLDRNGVLMPETERLWADRRQRVRPETSVFFWRRAGISISFFKIGGARQQRGDDVVRVEMQMRPQDRDIGCGVQGRVVRRVYRIERRRACGKDVTKS